MTTDIEHGPDGVWELVEWPIVGEGVVTLTGDYCEIEAKFLELAEDPEVDMFYVEMRPEGGWQ